MKIPRFYESEHNFEQIHTFLKLYKCPFCNLIGFLILHGYLKGYDEKTGTYGIKRGHRIFCSNRKNRKGCGHTFSILMARFLKHIILSANTVWHFLKNILNGMCKRKAMGNIQSIFSESLAYNIWQRFCINQTHIRTNLLRLKKPPAIHTNIPHIQTILHLDESFSYSDCPISSFQLHFQLPFFDIALPKAGILK